MSYRIILCFELLSSHLKLLFRTAKSRVVLIGTPLHGNLGDHAIALSLCAMFRENKLRFVEISGAVYRRFAFILDKFIRSSDTICICGGGFLGSLWTVEDDMVLSIIEKRRENKIVIAPQSIFFYENDTERMKHFKAVYGLHRNLTLYLREENSFALATALLSGTSCRVKKCPDMVLSLKVPLVKTAERTNQILLCLRTDKERVLSEENKAFIQGKIKAEGFECSEISTVIPTAISAQERKRKLSALLSEFSSARLVIADRLHAMLFAYITETPCIVFDNISRKVSGVYEWIKDCGFVRYCDSFDESALDFDLPSGTRKDFSAEFMPLIEELEK